MTVAGIDRVGTTLSVTTEDLTVAVDGVVADVRSTGDTLLFELHTVRDALRAARSLGGGPNEQALRELLYATGLSVEVRVRHRTVAVLGTRATPGFVSRRVAGCDVELRPLGAVSALADGVRSLRGAGRRLLR
ncbi:hypothetical protein JCM18237_12250 [Halorubrum luteum]